ncbi:hypothetical protein SLOPH_1116, partial [Spraguea lophii 42_110]
LHNQILSGLDKKEKTLEDNFKEASKALKDCKSDIQILLDEFLDSIKKNNMSRIVCKTFNINFDTYDNRINKLKSTLDLYLSEMSETINNHQLLLEIKQIISEYIIFKKIGNLKDDKKIKENSIIVQKIENVFKSLNEYAKGAIGEYPIDDYKEIFDDKGLNDLKNLLARIDDKKVRNNNRGKHVKIKF